MKTVRLLWHHPAPTRAIVRYGKLENIRQNDSEVFLTCSEEMLEPGPYATVVQVQGEKSFAFFLRDVKKEYPIYVPSCGAIVTEQEDGRTYEQIKTEIEASGALSKAEKVEREDEYDYDRAARETYELKCPAWLGISKDMRFFQLAVHGGQSGDDEQIYDLIQPRFFSLGPREKEFPELKEKTEMGLPDTLKGRPYSIRMYNGRGIGCRNIVSKRLCKGYLPIVEVTDDDDGMTYHTTFFATLEKQALKSENIRGTDMYAADACGVGYMQTPEHQEYTEAILDGEFSREEETVLYVRVVAENKGAAPAYAFILAPVPLMDKEGYYYDAPKGVVRFTSSGRCCATARMNGKVMPDIEMAVLLAPGETATFDYQIPHTPIDEERAAALLQNRFEQRLDEAVDFWENELSSAARIHLPESRIEEMIKADLLHQDIAYFGKNPQDPVVPIVGVYTAIGSESSPGIQFLDAMGMHELAERSIQYFVEKQHANGMIQNFGGYMLETGSTLWTMGEHWRLTRDTEWLKRVHGAIVKAADYLLRWREENLEDSLKDGKGYGMIKGKVADPNDFYHSFMLNAGACAGIARAAEMLADIDAEHSKRYAAVAGEMKANIYESLEKSMGRSPVIPLSNGKWARSCPLWPEHTGPCCLYADGGTWYTHASFVLRDVIGPVYLILQGVLDPGDPLAEELLEYTSEFLAINNVCFSQPYYSPHPYGQLLRGQRKLFLQEFYCGFAGLADRGTYSFWEHYFRASPHKLHEENWFAMRWRWMMAYEDYEKRQLHLLDGIPRKWLADGKEISVDGMKTYFGPVSCCVTSDLQNNRITVRIRVAAEGFLQPEGITVRIPHPETKMPVAVSMGVFDAENERVCLPAGVTQAELTVSYR